MCKVGNGTKNRKGYYMGKHVVYREMKSILYFVRAKSTVGTKSTLLHLHCCYQSGLVHWLAGF